MGRNKRGTMTMIFLRLLAISPFFQQGGFAALTNCGSAYPVNHLYVDPPFAVAVNQPVHISVSFNALEPILNGTLHTSVHMNYINVFESTELFYRHLAIPLSVGPHVINRTTTFPQDLWGKIQLTFSFYNQENRRFLCVQYNVVATGSNTNKTGWASLLSL
jgi:hypothetical protein